TSLQVSMPAVDQAMIPYDPTLVPVVGNNFTLTIQGTQVGVTFIADASGTSRYFRTRIFVGTRPPAPAPPPKTLSAIDAVRLASAIRRARPRLAESLVHPRP